MSKTLTQIGIDKIKAPSKRSEIPDAGVKGLYLVVQPSGVKSFAYRYRYRGKTKKMTLGRFPKMSLSEARNAARDALHHVERGNNPQDYKPAPEHFEAAFQEFLDRHISQNKSRYEVKRQFKHDLLPAFGKMPISEISKRDVIDLLDQVVDRGAKVMANRLLATLRKFFFWAASRDLTSNNPCLNLKLPSKESSRERVLSSKEIKLLWAATERLATPRDKQRAYERYFKFLLLSGQRRTEISQMRYEEIHDEEWLIPKERSKNGKGHSVPLTPFMKAIIDDCAHRDGYVFSVGQKHPINNIGRATSRLKKIMLQLSDEPLQNDWKPHDLRRTVASEMARLGVFQEVIERVQNRSDGKLRGVAGVYNRYDYASEKRSALEGWNRTLQKYLNE
jgi:integrase